MKPCPNCGKSVQDYAKKCKYCDHDIPSYEPAAGTGPAALMCPTCGGSLDFTGLSPTAVCSRCGNTVVVPSRPVPPPEPVVPMEESNLPLSEQVERLVREGKAERAVTLLRDQLLIEKSTAEKVVATIESGGYGDAKALFQDAMHGKV